MNLAQSVTATVEVKNLSVDFGILSLSLGCIDSLQVLIAQENADPWS